MNKIALRVDYFAAFKKCGQAEDFPSWGEIAHCASRGGVHALAVNLGPRGDQWTEQDLLELKRTSKLPLHLIAPLTAATLMNVTKTQPQVVWLTAPGDHNGFSEALKLDKIQPLAAKTIQALIKKKIKPFFVLSPEASAIRLAKRLGVSGVALNSWPLGQAKNRAKKDKILENLNIAGRLVRELDLELHIAGEVDYKTVEELSSIPDISFLHLGYSVIARSLLVGLGGAIEEVTEDMPAGSEFSMALEA